MAFRLHLSAGPSALHAVGLPSDRLNAEAEIVSASFGQFSVFQSRQKEGLVASCQFFDSSARIKTSRIVYRTQFKAGI